MDYLHFKLGEDFGDLLLDLAQEKIYRGNPEEGINVYLQAIPGFTEELVIKLLKNEGVLVVTEDGSSVTYSDDPLLLEKNRSNIYDWNDLIKTKENSLNNYRDIRLNLIDSLHRLTKEGAISDFNIPRYMSQNYPDISIDDPNSVVTLAMRLVAGDNFSSISPEGNRIWHELVDRCEDGEAEEYEYILFYIVRYNWIMNKILEEFMQFLRIYFFLEKNNLINHIPFIENDFESILDILKRHLDTSNGYYHPICNTRLFAYKTESFSKLQELEIAKKFYKEGFLEKNILDGYDAGWLSPDGKYFAENGDTSALIHLVLSEKIFHGDNEYSKQMKNDGVLPISSNSPERWLEKNGWIKIHHQDCYGSFIGNKDWTEYPYCPTDIQIKLICKYADLFYGGKFYTEANSLGRTSHPEPYSTYAVRQMDEHALHKIFGF